jgi:GxxExxY protein
MLHKELSETAIGCAYTVYNKMGFGYEESVYENCMMIELSKAGLKAERQVPINVYYDEHLVGHFKADILLEDALIIELKSVRTLASAHEAQLVNYLVATRKDVGLLINFAETKVEIRRKTRLLGQDKLEQAH